MTTDAQNIRRSATINLARSCVPGNRFEVTQNLPFPVRVSPLDSTSFGTPSAGRQSRAVKPPNRGIYPVTASRVSIGPLMSVPRFLWGLLEWALVRAAFRGDVRKERELCRLATRACVVWSTAR